MEFSLIDSQLKIESEKKEILIWNGTCMLDTMLIEVPWEYEKGGFLLYASLHAWKLIFQFQIEGYSCAYIGDSSSELSTDILDFLGDLDILFLSWVDEVKWILGKIDPRLVVVFDASPKDLESVFPGITWVQKWKLRESDFSLEKTNCIFLQTEKSQ